MRKENIEEENEELLESESNKKKSHFFIKLIILIILILCSIYFYSRYIGTKGLVVKEYRVTSNILTKNFSGIKVIHFSDLDYKSTFDETDIDELINRINQYKPDIVVFTGDLVSKQAKLTTNDITVLKAKLSEIEAKIGKYAIYGDQDYNVNEYDSIMSYANFKILNNSYDEVYYNTSEPLYIVGLPSSIKESINIDESFKFYNDENRRYIITLVHDGKSIKYIDDSTYEVDLILGGHSLGGLINIPYYGGLIKDDNSYKYYKEYYKKGITNIYISSGLGTNEIQNRLFNHPSFNVYRLKAQ